MLDQSNLFVRSTSLLTLCPLPYPALSLYISSASSLTSLSCDRGKLSSSPLTETMKVLGFDTVVTMPVCVSREVEDVESARMMTLSSMKMGSPSSHCGISSSVMRRGSGFLPVLAYSSSCRAFSFMSISLNRSISSCDRAMSSFTSSSVCTCSFACSILLSNSFASFCFSNSCVSSTSVRRLNLPVSIARSSFASLVCALLFTFSSTVLGVMSRRTRHCFVCPSLCTRAFACSSIIGFQSLS
mmetsp:Transcript_22218/g.73121  ORF Transcript_22218/g.73121 Transcript_22218/m.73121 type:complete len:242 (-) Transcript_22218:1540-2265(-)